ncbi:hypothetical protein M23134_05313 [Microscilla marina ATCC 23134]|uniref:Uncharacterized protein n=1 Tax=Microscilla marina ATCC 23134 TaxID=313606 RepID=A1ZHH3_MICM2|nr:hypothetical protein M23134_05313 [Microscilla marina ATCC 23134]
MLPPAGGGIFTFQDLSTLLPLPNKLTGVTYALKADFYQ